MANQVKSDKDYSQYFQPPSLTDAKKRGKEEIAVHYDFTIPEDMQEFGKDKYYLIRTYGCQMNEHDTEVMKGLTRANGLSNDRGQEPSRCYSAQHLCDSGECRR